MNFNQFCSKYEEWKPFPKDKVERSIEKKEKGNLDDKLKAHTQRAVKNYKTKSTDFSKADQKLTGSDRAKYNNKIGQHEDKRTKGID